MRQSYYNNNCISSPWWLLAGSSLTGDILIVGELEAGDLCLMRALAKSVKSISLDNFATEQPTGLYSSVFLMTKDIKDKSRRNALAAGITKKLRDDGVLIVYGQEVRPENCTLQISLPCITYNKYPFEAYQKGNYSSNKNQCLIKEKIKRIILNLPLYKLFIRNHIYVYSKSRKQSHLLTELDRLIASHHNTFIKRDQNRKLSKLYFKYGKVIAIYNSSAKHANLVIVIPTDQEAQRQRLNEYKSRQRNL